MTAILSALRERLSYATVLSLLSAFVFLCGATAFAANQLAKNSVGTKQLKKNAVTTAKIKRNAVTTAKIRNGAVTGAKVKDGSLTGGNFDLSSMAYGRIVHQVRASGIALANAPVIIPIEGATYSQPANRNDSIMGDAVVTFPAGCTDANAFVYLLIDSSDPTTPEIYELAAAATFERDGSEQVTMRRPIFPFVGGTGIATPMSGTATHTFTALAGAECSSGGGTVTLDTLEIDLIGTP